MFNPKKFACAAALDALHAYVKHTMSNGRLPFHVPHPIATEEIDGDSRFGALCVLQQANVLASDIVNQIHSRLEHGDALFKALFPDERLTATTNISNEEVKRRIWLIQLELHPTMKLEWEKDMLAVNVRTMLAMN